MGNQNSWKCSWQIKRGGKTLQEYFNTASCLLRDKSIHTHTATRHSTTLLFLASSFIVIMDGCMLMLLNWKSAKAVHNINYSLYKMVLIQNRHPVSSHSSGRKEKKKKSSSQKSTAVKLEGEKKKRKKEKYSISVQRFEARPQNTSLHVELDGRLGYWC